MCQRCLDAVKRHWPDLSETEQGILLWNATAFPFSGPETTEKQLKEMAERSGRDLGKAIALAEADMEAAMAEAPKEK